MRAIVFDQFGGPDVYRLADVPVPEPGEGEVQVQVAGAGLNPVDWKVREGLYPAAPPKTFPAIALREFSGTVSAVGPGVTAFQIGDEVYGLTGNGAACEYTVARADAMAIRPHSMDPADAGLVPLAGMTAWQALFVHGEIKAGQRVFIHAAAGGVGTFAVQLAKWKGCYVIGTALKRNHHLVHEIGADEVIDYKEKNFADEVKDVDMVLHSVGPEDLEGSLKILKPGGRLVAIAAKPDEEAAKAQGKAATTFSMQPQTDHLNQLCSLIQDLQVRPVIDTILPLARLGEAMSELQQGHTVGKMGVRI
jgi:NADPH:quinone reductase-like Zn-dependent oxidoreductase